MKITFKKYNTGLFLFIFEQTHFPPVQPTTYSGALVL